MIVDKAQPVPILWDDKEVLFPNYEILPYAFARAQEFSLFRLNSSYLARPTADFGCGDGSFAAVLFDEVDFGIDNDPQALEIAKGYGVYHETVVSGDKKIPLASDSVQSVISNSVLEHVIDLEFYLNEIHRILQAGGFLVFTVPLTSFRDDLAKYFGMKASIRLNKEAYHRNLYSDQEWHEVLKNHGFEVILEKQYQPDWFTFWCEILRFTGRTGLGLIIPGLSNWIRNRYKRRFVEAIRKSITQTEKGDNAFFVAQKK